MTFIIFQETMSMIRGAGKHVQLLMCHPDPEQLPPLTHLVSLTFIQRIYMEVYHEVVD